MDHPSPTIQQSFGTTVLGVGAVANQGNFQQCTFFPSFTPEILLQFQQFLSAQTDARNTDRLFRSISQLGDLNTHARVTLAGPDAGRVLDNIGNVLQALSPPPASPHILDREATQGHDTNHGDSPGLHDAVEAIRRILCASEYVDVNQTHAIRREVSHGSTSTVLSKIEDELDIAHAQVRVYAWKRRLLPSREGNSTCDEFTVRIDIQPKLEGAPDKSPYISIYLQQTRGLGRSIFVDPMIVARRIIPDSSPVFQMIRDGDFGGFRGLLQNGQASLWDCDSRGCSLIAYANYHLQLDILKYLIQKGADVDCIEPPPERNHYHWPPKPLLSHHFYQRDKKSNLILNTFRCLLEAGADPTLGHYQSLLSNISTSEWPYTEEIADLILQFGSEYVDVKAYDPGGNTMLLHHCSRASYDTRIVRERLNSLITLGSTVDERDRDGNTCLHLVWGEFLDNWQHADFFMLIHHLLDLGADANASNDSNKTPSDMVFSGYYTAFYKIWDLALHVKGIKVDDWEVKKQILHEREDIDFRIPPLSERDALISEHDWLKRVWSEAPKWVNRGRDRDFLESYGLELDGLEPDGSETEAEETEAEETEAEETEAEETEAEETEAEEIEAEEIEKRELADTRARNKRKRLAYGQTSGFEAPTLGPLGRTFKTRRLE